MTSTSSSSFFRSDAQRFEIYIPAPHIGTHLLPETEELITDFLRELLPGEQFPDEVCFKGWACFLNYSSRSGADDALATLHFFVPFDTTSAIEQAFRAAKPSAATMSPTNGLHKLFCSNEAHLPVEVLRAAVKRVLGGDKMSLLPTAIQCSSSSTGAVVNTFIDFHSREALGRALRIFRGIPAGTADGAEQVLTAAQLETKTAAAYAAADRARGGVAASATAQQQRRTSDSAPAGGGAASAAALHPCLSQNPAGRCTLPSPCRFGMVRADRCLMWLAGLCGENGDHDGLGHELTATEQHTIAALQQLQQQQQPPPQRQPLQQQQQQQQQQPHQQAHGYDQVAQAPPPPPGQQHQFVCDANYQQERQQQPAYQQQQAPHEHAGQRRDRQDLGDDGFASRRHGRYSNINHIYKKKET